MSAILSPPWSYIIVAAATWVACLNRRTLKAWGVKLFQRFITGGDDSTTTPPTPKA